MMRLESPSSLRLEQRHLFRSSSKSSNSGETIGSNTSRSQKLRLTAPHALPGGLTEFSSNLEFTASLRDRQTTLTYFRPDILNLTPQKTPVELIKVAREVPQKTLCKQSFQSQQAFDIVQKEKRSSVESVSSSESIQETEPVPLYKKWPGKNRFYFNGRFITGPKSDRTTHVIFWCFFMAISITFFAAVFKFLILDVNILLPYVSVYLFLSTILFFLLVSCTDPGIVPRKWVWELNGGAPFPYSGVNTTNQSSHQHTTLDITRSKSFSKETANLGFCQVCNIYKTSQTVHCKECDNCVEMFVYHSHVLGNCIGKRNYRFFIGFVISFSLLSISYACSFLIMIIITTGCDPNKEPSNLFKTTTVTIITILLFIIPSVLLFFMKLILLYVYILENLKKAKLSSNKRNIESKNKNKNHVINLISWLGTTSSLFNPRQSISPEELLRFQTITQGSK